MKVIIPQMPGAKEVVIGEVYVNKGDEVKKDQPLYEVETSKGVRQIKAETDGVIEEVYLVSGEKQLLGSDAFEIKELRNETTTSDTHTDVLIIGGGTGGYVAAIYASRCGKNVTLIEKNKLGGTCLNVGCIPTKSLIASSHKYQDALSGDLFGFDVTGEVKVNLEKIIARKNAVVERLVSGISFLMDKNNITVIQGEAHFTNDKTVEVNGVSYTFDDCIIATGSEVSMPPIEGIESSRIYHSTSLLDNTKLPQSMVIVGGGVIGLEFAFLMKNLGVEVTVVEFLDRLLANMDSELSSEILRQVKKKKIKVELSSKVLKFEEKEDSIVTSYEKNGETKQVESDIVLVATGRKANTEGLGLENTSIVMNEGNRGIHVNEYLQTNVEHIYAVGDVNNVLQLAHAASAQGMAAVNHILGKPSNYFEQAVPSVVFTSPEIASVGLSEDACKEKGINYKKGVFHYRANGKALTMNEIDGFIKILKDENDVIIGAHIIGADASTLIATLGLCVSNQMTDGQIEHTIFAHPTTAEVIHEAALDLSIGSFHE